MKLCRPVYGARPASQIDSAHLLGVTWLTVEGIVTLRKHDADADGVRIVLV